jgi:iron complex outermembrane receptor protein
MTSMKTTARGTATSRLRQHVRLVLGLAAAGLLAGQAVEAQQADTTTRLEAVTIVAQKQPYRGDLELKELPQSVQVLSGTLLQDVGVTDFEGALDFASSLARQNSFGGLWDSFAIRGFAGDENVPSGYLVNGFNAGRGFSGRRDASNVERIEILKGPGSALFGRSEPGGTINIVTKKPMFEPQGEIELAGGSNNMYRVSADYTGPISDNVAFRINGAYQDSDSVRDFVSFRKYVISPSFLARLGESTTVSYELEVVDQEAPFDRGIAAPGGVLGIVSRSRFLGEPNDGPMKIKAQSHQLVVQHDLDSGWSILGGFGYFDSSFKGFSSDAELAGSRQPFYTDGRTLARQRRFRDYSATDKTGRLELAGEWNAGVVHHLLFGADIYDFDLDQVQNRFRPPSLAGSPTFAQQYAIDVLAPVYGQTQPVPGTFTSTLENQKAYGLYFQDQMDLTEQWKFMVGVRYDDFDQKLLNRLNSTTARQSVTATSPRVGLVYEASDLLSVYASYAEGFRPNSGSSAAGESFKPEESKSYEVGVKFGLADGRIGGTVAVYKARKSNILTSDPVNAGFSLAVGEAESKGLEFDLSGELVEDLQLSLSYAYTEAEFTKDVLDPNFGLALPAGTPLINIPKSSGSVLLLRDFHVASSTFGLGVGLNYVGERIGETGTPSYVLPDYWLARLLAYYEPSEHLKFTADVTNLFDEDYYPSSYHRLWTMPGDDRQFSIRAQYRF